MVQELDNIMDDIECFMTTIKECNERLSPNPLSITEHIDLMIENEKLLKKHGFLDRINALNELRKKTLIKSADHSSRVMKMAELGPVKDNIK
ncbi:hypothetical protein MAR_033481 [Mya arenaria]|uniref:Uncharacterized protein n=1 Tax=Mya arenaria TaxID=6604 RepID=A0ABY7GC72_MYAAR|nr:hypothetical protein MAR_033481 [Mya arenaria]